MTVNVANGPPPDTTPPTVSIASPTGGNVSGTVTVSANASDNVGVTRVDFYINGGYAGTSGASPYQYSWNTAALPNGAASLFAKAFDAAGNASQSAGVTVNVANGPPPDTTPPTVGIVSPTGGNVSGTVTVSANASDNVGVTRVDFYVNGALVGSDATTPYQYAWNTAASANGPATLYAKAFDAAGNAAQSATVTVNVANVVAPPPDTTPPTVAITSPTGGNVAGTVTVSANASDNVGVARVDFYVNGGLVGSDAAAPYQYTWNTTGLANGPATLYAKAFDAAGNSAQSATVAVTVANVVAPPPDASPPVVTLLSPNGGIVSGQVNVTASATDNVGVARVDLLINGGVVGTVANAPWSFTWNSRSVSNGAAQIQVAAVDAAGNRGTSATVTVTVANNGGGKPRKLAVEYYNAQLDHYFITAMDDEVYALDADTSPDGAGRDSPRRLRRRNRGWQPGVPLRHAASVWRLALLFGNAGRVRAGCTEVPRLRVRVDRGVPDRHARSHERPMPAGYGAGLSTVERPDRLQPSLHGRPPDPRPDGREGLHRRRLRRRPGHHVRIAVAVDAVPSYVATPPSRRGHFFRRVV